jgi:type IX secretion system PorP/SprF family membrane protein
MKSRFTIFILLLSLTVLTTSQAQDIHFSQFYTQPWLVNPAKVGFFNGNYQLSAIYRSQWSSITSGYQTFAASGQMSWVLKGTNRSIIGIEAHAYSDKAGDAGYTTDNLGCTIAYNMCLDRFHTQYIGLGSSISYANNYFDLSQLTFDNEYSGTVSRERFTSTNISYPDLAEGAEYNFLPSPKFNLNVGAAVYHINTPNVTFTADQDSKLPRDYIFNAGATYVASYTYSWYPRVIVCYQGPNKEIDAGSFLGIRLDKEKENEKYRIYFGAWYRWDDAIIAVVRLDMTDVSMGLSYDINVSSLYIASYGRGGPEFSITYNGLFDNAKAKKITCPKF